MGASILPIQSKNKAGQKTDRSVVAEPANQSGKWRCICFDNALPGKDANRTLQSIHLRTDSIDLVLPENLSRAVAARIEGEEQVASRDQQCVVTIPISLPLRGGRRSITAGQPDAADHDTILITALRKAHAMIDRDERGQPLVGTAPKSPYERRLLRLAFLAPDIQQAILAGHQPRGLNLEQMKHQDLPIAWSKQREMLGFKPAVKILLWSIKCPVPANNRETGFSVPNPAEMCGFGGALRPLARRMACFKAAFLHFSLLSLRNRETGPIAIRAETAGWEWLGWQSETAHIAWLETDWTLQPRQRRRVPAPP